jgi:phage shock protein A
MKTVPILPVIMASASWILPPLSQTWSCQAFAPSLKKQGIRKRDSCQNSERLVGPSSGNIVPFMRPSPVTRHSLMANGSEGGNVLDRLSRAVKSNVSQMACNLESSEKGIVQAVEDLKVTVSRRLGVHAVNCFSPSYVQLLNFVLLVLLLCQANWEQIRQAYVEAWASHGRIERQYQEAQQTADTWYSRAQLALRTNSNEDLARQALLRWQTHTNRAQALQREVEASQRRLDTLFGAQSRLEAQMAQAKVQQAQLLARAQAAAATTQINAMVSSSLASSVRNNRDAAARCRTALERMERQVETLEAAADVASTLDNTDSVLEVEFRQLEQSTRIDAELRALKQGLNAPNPSKSLLGGGHGTNDCNDDNLDRSPISVRNESM